MLLPTYLNHINYFQWIPEITHHVPTAVYLIVGTQNDLRDDPTKISELQRDRKVMSKFLISTSHDIWAESHRSVADNCLLHKSLEIIFPHPWY